MTEKENVWQGLNVTKELAQVLQWPFFPLGWINLISGSYSPGMLNGVAALGFQKDSGLLKLDFEGGFSCSLSYK